MTTSTFPARIGDQLDLVPAERPKHPEVFPGCVLDGAGFSADRNYRYWLSRKVPNTGATTTVPILWLMLNPSIADETVLDPTLRRCMDFTRRLGGTQMLVGNLFALVSTDPRELGKASDPMGPHNGENIAKMHRWAATTIVGWGAHKLAAEQARLFLKFYEGKSLKCLGVNSDGSPKHPLYLKATAELMDWPVQMTTTPTPAERTAEAREMLAKRIVEFRAATIGPSRDASLALVSDALIALMAAAWAEGYQAGASGAPEDATPNPYEKARS